MLDNAVYFYDAGLPSTTPLRSESSRTDYDGEIRHRGSVLNLFYTAPDRTEINHKKLSQSRDVSLMSDQLSENSVDSMREITLK